MLPHDVRSLVESVSPFLLASVRLGNPHLVVRGHLQTELICLHLVHIALVVVLERLEGMLIDNPTVLKRRYLVLQCYRINRLPTHCRQDIMVVGHAVLLVNDHVLQALVEGRTHEDLCLHHLTRLAVVQDLIAVGVHSQVQHVLLQIINLEVRIRRSVTKSTLSNTNLAKDVLHQLCNRHTRRNSVRIHDDVGTQTTCSKRHVLLIHQHSNGSLLTVTR